jgi:hypothetical protein
MANVPFGCGTGTGDAATESVASARKAMAGLKNIVNSRLGTSVKSVQYIVIVYLCTFRFPPLAPRWDVQYFDSSPSYRSKSNIAPANHSVQHHSALPMGSQSFAIARHKPHFCGETRYAENVRHFVERATGRCLYFRTASCASFTRFGEP